MAGRALPGENQWSVVSVAAVMVTGDGRYLLQQRDDVPWLRVPGHWCLFGGSMESGEAPEEAMLRELLEELEYVPRQIRWFTEMGFVLPQLDVTGTRKVYFEIPIEPADIDRMVQHEGAGRGLFTLAELLQHDRITPWDVYALMLHARQATIFRKPAPVPADAAD
jgi:8-oxo-dGTP pyrophosphatase MutT (NUDIX family)